MKTSNEEGFTVIEFFVSIFMTLIVLGVIYSVFRLQTRSLKSQENRMEAQQYTRSVLNLMVREVRNLGHFPGVECTTSPVAHVNGIIEANANVFHFVTDANADDLCDDENENILYSIDTANCPAGFGNLTRQDVNAIDPAAQALTDCNVPMVGSDLLFVYYEKDSTDALTTPVTTKLGDIKRVRITTTVESKNPDNEFGGASTAVMKSNVDLRNRGLPQ